MAPEDGARKVTRRKAYYQANREKELAQNRLYHEAHADELKRRERERYQALRQDEPRYQQWLAKRRRRLNSSPRREEHAESARRWYHANKKHGYTTRRAWCITHSDKVKEYDAKRRAVKRQATVAPVDYGFIVRRDNMRCGICGRKVTRRTLHFDHIIPLARGGAHAQWNIQVAHAACNQRKFLGRLPSQTRLPF